MSHTRTNMTLLTPRTSHTHFALERAASKHEFGFGSIRT